LIVARDKRFLFSPKCPEWFWGTPSLCFSGFWASVSLGLKQLCGKLHSLPVTAEVKNAWYYCSTSISVLVLVVVVVLY
jgi:hypothetical protein